MEVCHLARALLISSIVLAEPLLSNTLMIIYIAAAATLVICLTHYQFRLTEERAVRQALCKMKTDIIAAAAGPREQ